MACGKPERPMPAGPGLTADKAAVRVEQVPQVSEAMRASSLSAEQRAVVVARIGDRPITLGELETRLAQEPSVVQSQFASVQKRKEYLAKLVQFEVLAMEAQRQGLDKDPEVVEALRQAMVRKYLQTQVGGDVDPKTIADADIRAYYDANPQVFHKPEQVELSHILVSDRARAEQIRSELDKGSEGNAGKLVQLWNDYVVRQSEDKASAPYLGALGVVSQTPPPGASPAELERLAAIPKVLIDAAFALQPYTLGPLVQTPAGWHIVMITSRTPAVDKSFEDAKESIRARIAKRERDLRRDKLLADLKAKAKIEIDDDAVRLLPQVKVERAPKLGGAAAGAGHDHGAEALPGPASGVAP
jgi:peptidyl-prolyl cis-trans isomerase C